VGHGGGGEKENPLGGRWLGQLPKKWKGGGVISGGMNGIFHRPNPSGHTMALESTLPLT